MEERISKDISHTLHEGVVFSFSPKNTQQVVKKTKKLEEIINIKMHGNESIIEARRQHPIVLLAPSLIILFLIFTTLFPFFANSFQSLINIPNVVLIEYALTMICLILVLLTYSYMYWYYQFYVVTNKCLFHKHFFRIGGYYSEEVFLETSPERDITRGASNFFYSLIDIDDVTVAFQRAGLGDFVFKTPQNAQKIEDALEEVVIGSKLKV